jgi:hypothetical protein
MEGGSGEGDWREWGRDDEWIEPEWGRDKSSRQYGDGGVWAKMIGTAQSRTR